MGSIKPTRFYSNKQERNVAKTLNGKQVTNSGATKFNKGDIVTDLFLIEAKTCTTEKKSFTIKHDWLVKNKEEAFDMGKEYNALVFNFGPDTQNYYVIDEYTFKEMLKIMQELKEEIT